MDNNNLYGNYNENDLNNSEGTNNHLKLDDGDENESHSNEDSRKRHKRRSKTDNDGRNHKCSICGKSYLSYPALYTHIKTKHNTNGAASGRGRGRPKKDTGETINSIKLLYNPSTMDFFKHPDKIGETSNIRDSAIRVFSDIYDPRNENRNSLKKMKHYQTINVHPFLVKVIQFFDSPKTLDGENTKCDEVFCEYLHKVSKLTKPEVFTKMLKFLTLFRESLNIINAEKLKGEDKDYSEEFNAEDAPDISNEFVTEFLDTESNQFNMGKEEAIDFTQNFCQWMYDNNYTCSKLSLINQ